MVLSFTPSFPNTLANVATPNITLNNLKFSLSAPYLPIDNLELWLLYALTSTPSPLKNKSGSSPDLPSSTFTLDFE